jgi:hypothetical protein
MRQARIERKTKETEIAVSVNLDGTGKYNVSTGIGFLDHMLEQLSRHSLMDLEVKAKGDLHIDFHHTTEDTGIAIGEAVNKALGDRKGIVRFGSALVPLDEALSQVVVDCSNRPYLVWKVNFTRPKLGDMDTGLRPGGGPYPPCRNALRRQQSPYRRVGLQGSRACVPHGDHPRRPGTWCCSLDEGRSFQPALGAHPHALLHHSRAAPPLGLA